MLNHREEARDHIGRKLLGDRRERTGEQHRGDRGDVDSDSFVLVHIGEPIARGGEGGREISERG